jgi:hypothetical protein
MQMGTVLEETVLYIFLGWANPVAAAEYRAIAYVPHNGTSIAVCVCVCVCVWLFMSMYMRVSDRGVGRIAACRQTASLSRSLFLPVCMCMCTYALAD